MFQEIVVGFIVIAAFVIRKVQRPERFVGKVREPARDKPVEIGWRPVDPTQDLAEAAFFDDQPWPEDLTVLYYWRPTYWRRRP